MSYQSVRCIQQLTIHSHNIFIFIPLKLNQIAGEGIKLDFPDKTSAGDFSCRHNLKRVVSAILFCPSWLYPATDSTANICHVILNAASIFSRSIPSHLTAQTTCPNSYLRPAREVAYLLRLTKYWFFFTIIWKISYNFSIQSDSPSNGE